MDRALSRTVFHPAYWARTRVDRAIAAHATFAHGLLLDVGCGLKPHERVFDRHVSRYLGIELSVDSGYRGNRADLYGTASALPIGDACIDTVLCTEVLEHVPDPDAVVAEIARVLRPGGIVLMTAPFVYPVHDKWDFFRYAPDGVSTLMRRHGLIVDRVVPLSGTAVTLALLANVYWFEIGFLWTKWLYPLGLVLRPFLLLVVAAVNLGGRALEDLLPSDHLAFDHLTLGRKA